MPTFGRPCDTGSRARPIPVNRTNGYQLAVRCCTKSDPVASVPLPKRTSVVPPEPNVVSIDPSALNLAKSMQYFWLKMAAPAMTSLPSACKAACRIMTAVDI